MTIVQIIDHLLSVEDKKKRNIIIFLSGIRF